MSSKIENYLKLEKKLEELTCLGNIANIAHWDSATMLGIGSAANRQKEMAIFSSVIHEMATSNKMGDLINSSLAEFDYLDDWQRSNLASAKKSYDSQICLTADIQHEHSIASSECEFTWRSARKENDFKKL